MTKKSMACTHRYALVQDWHGLMKECPVQGLQSIRGGMSQLHQSFLTWSMMSQSSCPNWFRRVAAPRPVGPVPRISIST
eukprot:1152352-Pelagomonas_calceolata.AAC.2